MAFEERLATGRFDHFCNLWRVLPILQNVPWKKLIKFAFSGQAVAFLGLSKAIFQASPYQSVKSELLPSKATSVCGGISLHSRPMPKPKRPKRKRPPDRVNRLCEAIGGLRE